jgi:glutaredoxin-like YruB-family protein
MAVVKVYSTPACPYCKRAKEFLREKGIAFEDVDVSTDSRSADEMVKKSRQMGVPVIDIDGKIIVGFERDAISDALGIKS